MRSDLLEAKDKAAHRRGQGQGQGLEVEACPLGPNPWVDGMTKGADSTGEAMHI